MQEKTKIALDDIESGTMQDITRQFISNHIYCNQSCLVSELMDRGVISIEDYINLYKSDETIKSDYDVKTEEEIEMALYESENLTAEEYDGMNLKQRNKFYKKAKKIVAKRVKKLYG